ncbi:MAG: hypothetical protein GXX87_00735 [Euryarchaeota archaeon]|nr:hypothetical protein [Euryarchaeota archaeon]
MDRAQAFEGIRKSIAAGDLAAVGPQVAGIAASAADEPLVLLTCLSLLRSVGETETAETVLGMIAASLRADPSAALETARGLRGLGYRREAHAALAALPADDAVERERMAALHGMGEHADAVAAYGRIAEPTVDDDVLAAEAFCSLGDFASADALAARLMEEMPSDFRAGRCRCSVLLRRGLSREAGDLVKAALKADKRSADANALAAYFMWMSGKTAAAGGYAAKAVRADPGHVDAMEILALCLIEKGKRDNARIIAGAINEQAPGHDAVMRILDACR